jgi:hypothetical protein
MRALLVLAIQLGLGLELGRGPAPSTTPDDPAVAAALEALAVDPVLAGASGELSLIVLEAADRRLPLTIRLDPGPLTLADNRLDWSAVVDPLASQPRIRAKFRAPSEAGRYSVRASVDYYVCSEQWCRRKHGEVTWLVAVE